MSWSKIIKVTTAISLLFPLVGCTGGEKEVEEAGDAKELFGCNVINIYNAGEYIDESVVPNFEKMYNAKVNYDTFESNEMMYTKLLGGNSYDVLVPSDYMIEQLMQEGLLQKLDQSAMTNKGMLDPFVIEMQKVFDPELEYAMPYFWGNVGLVYNKENVSEDDLKTQGWDILKNEKYKGRIYFYDSQRDGFMIAFKALGYSMNTDNTEEIQAAYQWLREMNETMEPAYVTDEVIDEMVNGSKDIAVMYSGDATYVMSENEDLGWYAPEQGTNLWIDAMVIPKNATCPGLANAFINYAISEDVQVKNTEFVAYTPVLTKVIEDMGGEDGDFSEISSFIPRTEYEKDEVFHYNPELKRQLSDLWNKVKIN
ncbi:MAG: ABC transporter substrate-binding protein [Solobacterium sp.]|nr:ABC transporter substrate-binding protein [Solobacterium sp.]